jgi:ATP-dependent Clp protease ATP-binding subunit ClpC
VLKEIRTRGDIILFIDEIHTLVGAGAAEGAIDAASILKPMLARGELQTIGATTLDEYRKHLEKDAALERRFQPVKVEEPTVAHTIEILKGLRERYERTTGSPSPTRPRGRGQPGRPLHLDRHLPDKAIDLIDEAGSRLRIKRMQTPPTTRRSRTSSPRSSSKKKEAVEAQTSRRPAPARPEKELLGPEGGQGDRDQGHRASTCSTRSTRSPSPRCSRCGPASRSTSSPRRRPPSCSHGGRAAQAGHRPGEAIKAVSQAIRRTRAGLKDPKRPSRLVHLPGPTRAWARPSWPRRSPSSCSATRRA